jgi:hypothetical protein
MREHGHEARLFEERRDERAILDGKWQQHLERNVLAKTARPGRVLSTLKRL